MVVTSSPVWAAIPAGVLVLTLVALAATLDAVLAPAVPGARPGVASSGQHGLIARAAMPWQELARLLRQRRRTTVAPDAVLWRIGSAGPLVVALLMSAVIPVGGHALTDLSVGIVWFNAMDVCLWATFWLLGWGANSAYGLIGGYRFLAQALAYELPLMFALTAPAVAAGSLGVGDVVAAQGSLWYVVWMPIAFLVLLGSVVGFSAWGPFAYPAGRDLAGGVLAELSGVDRLLLLVGRYALLVVGSGLAAALFLGGGAGPLLPGWLWSLVKLLLVLSALVAVRRRLPIVRADRFVRIAWLVILPATLVQLLVVTLIAYLTSGA